jgi:hypothetical protein
MPEVLWANKELNGLRSVLLAAADLKRRLSAIATGKTVESPFPVLPECGRERKREREIERERRGGGEWILKGKIHLVAGSQGTNDVRREEKTAAAAGGRRRAL